MIVKNEELILEKSLQSIKSIADEIIITDTGSTDKTVEIAKKFTNKIVDRDTNSRYINRLVCGSISGNDVFCRWFPFYNLE